MHCSCCCSSSTTCSCSCTACGCSVIRTGNGPVISCRHRRTGRCRGVNSDNLRNNIARPPHLNFGTRSHLIVINPTSMEARGSTNSGAREDHGIKENPRDQKTQVTDIPLHCSHNGTGCGGGRCNTRLPGDAICGIHGLALADLGFVGSGSRNIRCYHDAIHLVGTLGFSCTKHRAQSICVHFGGREDSGTGRFKACRAQKLVTVFG